MPTIKRETQSDGSPPPSGVKYYRDYFRSPAHIEAFKLVDGVREALERFELFMSARAPKRVRGDVEQARSDALGALQRIVLGEWDAIDDGTPVGEAWKTEVKRKGRAMSVQGQEVEAEDDEDEADRG